MSTFDIALGMIRDLKKKRLKYYTLFIVILVLLPFFASGLTAYAIMLLLFVTLAVGWNIQGGYLGDLSFGHVSFFGIAAYTAALLEHYDLLHLPPVNILLGALMTSAFAILIGIPFLRLRGFYFAIGTLGLSSLLLLVFKNILSPITLGATGVMIPPPTPYRIELFYYGILVITIFSISLANIIIKSRYGLAFSAIRDDPDAARATGINVTYYRIMGFAVSAFVTGVGGGFYAYHNNYVNPAGVFSSSISFEIFVMVFLGGAGTLYGPVIGAILLYVIEEFGRTFMQQGYNILPAFMLVIVFITMPNGIVGIIKERRIFPKLINRLDKRKID